MLCYTIRLNSRGFLSCFKAYTRFLKALRSVQHSYNISRFYVALKSNLSFNIDQSPYEVLRNFQKFYLVGQCYLVIVLKFGPLNQPKPVKSAINLPKFNLKRSKWRSSDQRDNHNAIKQWLKPMTFVLFKRLGFFAELVAGLAGPEFDPCKYFLTHVEKSIQINIIHRNLLWNYEIFRLKIVENHMHTRVCIYGHYP